MPTSARQATVAMSLITAADSEPSSTSRGRRRGKGPGFGKSVSHSHRRTSRRWDPNIQPVHAVTHPGGNKKRINACTSCIKAGKVVRG
jgi:large subunit ribosomal protein L28